MAKSKKKSDVPVETTKAEENTQQQTGPETHSSMEAARHGEGDPVQSVEEEVDEKELMKEKPVECVVLTPNAILPVDAKRGKEKVEAGQKCQIGDTALLRPHVIKRHQNAGVGLSLVKSEA